jgi:hypothetical protein
MNPPETTAGSARHAGPHLGLVAIVFTALKLTSLIPVSAFGFAVGFLLPATIGERIGNPGQIA